MNRDECGLSSIELDFSKRVCIIIAESKAWGKKGEYDVPLLVSADM